MGLSRKNQKIQAAIADSLKKGLPLAGLLSSLMVTTGCDFVKGIMNRHTVGRIATPKPPAITTTEQAEEPIVQSSQDQQPDSPVRQNNEEESRPIMGKFASPDEEKQAEEKLRKAEKERRKAEEEKRKAELEKKSRPLMGVPLPPPAESPADKANQ